MWSFVGKTKHVGDSSQPSGSSYNDVLSIHCSRSLCFKRTLGKNKTNGDVVMSTNRSFSFHFLAQIGLFTRQSHIV